MIFLNTIGFSHHSSRDNQYTDDLPPCDNNLFFFKLKSTLFTDNYKVDVYN